jgi:hypothetical protein
MAQTTSETFRRTVVPAGAILVLAALAERVGADSATFYLFLAGLVVSAAGVLAAIARSVDASSGGDPVPLGRLQAWLSGLLAVVFFVGAAARSPLLLSVGGPGLVPAAVTLGLCLLCLLALVAAVPAGRR